MLRDYQIKHVAETMNALVKYDKVISVAPCGSGKTVMIADIIKNQLHLINAKTVLIVVHRDYLIGQISVTLSRQAIKHCIFAPNKTVTQIIHDLNYAGAMGYLLPSADVRILSVASYKSYLSLIEQSDLIITDEGHHDNGKNIWAKVREVAGEHKFLALTATPVRTDNTDMSDLYDTIVETVTIKDLIDMHYLTPFRVYAPKSIDKSQLKIGASGDYSQSSIEKANIPKQISSDVIKFYEENCINDRVLAYCDSIKSCEIFKGLFEEKGHKAAILHSKMSRFERDANLTGFKRGDFKIILTVSILSEGFDLPELTTVFLLNATRSYSKFIQEFTRCLRTHPSKQLAYVYDFVGIIQTVDNPEGLTLPTNYGRWSLDSDEKTTTKKVTYIDKPCTSCLALIPARVRVCPECGEAQENYTSEVKEKNFYMVDGELVEITDDVNTLALIALAKRIKPLKHYPQNVPQHVIMKIKRDNAELVLLLTELKKLLNVMQRTNISYSDLILWTKSDLTTIVNATKAELKDYIEKIKDNLK